jgi:2-polyprenyl-3-methyl-5-hydroxy-6-metoxy-1,4-benzoquinol methylase
MDFIRRSDQSELLDQQDIPAADITRNLYELGFINRWLGGHAITLSGFKQLTMGRQQIAVCEIGCGGGDNLQAIQRKNSQGKIALQYTGIDLNPVCIKTAQTLSWEPLPRFITSDYRQVVFESSPDILFSSLFCHHFKDEELVVMFRWMRQHARIGFFINDLHRHRIAYYTIRWLTAVFSRSYLVQHDAPVSVLRGFKRKELENILDKAGIQDYTIRWRWAFRWLIIVPS